ncbi:Twitching mobility protein [Enhygromyxa salina]|uniref:Twitching mobility protein n=2 Tax=Enhygromyxa salina TaxID=215803 RepID=A0A2S9XH86_9BACT|nr:Twitching mobility protein [Enhygromyxa salina]
MRALLCEARAAGCTDVHVTGGQPARLRRLAELAPVGDALPGPGQIEKMLMPLLDEAGDHAKARLAEFGYTDFAIEVPGAGRLRVNFARGQTGLKGCFRLVVQEPPSLNQLGLPVELQKVAQYHQGLAVVSGPSGQGKTTTMAALVDLVNRSKPDHIITVEDPIEVVHPIRKAVISQRQVGLHTKSFYAALKGALREDPDVIIIGELRDRETVEMAMQAAETGHLVIASMSTPSGAKTIDRLIDMFPPEDQAQVRSTLAGALKIVVSQRLVPNVAGTKMIAAAELITGNIPLWSLIRENKLFQLPSLLQRGRNYGMIRVEDSLNDLLARGLIDEDTARQYADDPRAINPGGVKPVAAPDSPGAAPPNQDIGKAALGAVRSMFGRGRKDDN